MDRVDFAGFHLGSCTSYETFKGSSFVFFSERVDGKALADLNDHHAGHDLGEGGNF